jgi:hypothetical protein
MNACGMAVVVSGFVIGMVCLLAGGLLAMLANTPKEK